ncbi:Trypsin domain protein [Candidatus Rhodobacter oscarellae]|uniref:Serine protease n=1 Tax=Candidatus Rhodobacter oscarellae TaxID=1675527 RepID=A0A0J9E0A3_9RHOB|nr:trypsin-like serine protease [Candidatus Rhodobacter lobularis]KMW56082.1 Trypsin domain protein [Candidatus Rhodobacter lobularis]
MRRGLFLIILVLFLGTEGQAQGTGQGSGLRTLMTGDDSRGWQGVGRLNIGDTSFCTGALIAENLVLTAAHCMYDMESGVRIADSEVEFLADWRGGRASAYRGVKRSLVHPDFAVSHATFVDRVAYDVALLELDAPIRSSAIAPFAVQSRPQDGAEVGVVSYAHDRADSPSLQEVCHVLARQNGSLVLSCDVDFGSSGAPIFVVEDGRARIVSLVSAKAKVQGKPVALGTALEVPLAELMAMRGADVAGAAAKPKPPVRRLALTQDGTGAKFLRP